MPKNKDGMEAHNLLGVVAGLVSIRDESSELSESSEWDESWDESSEWDYRPKTKVGFHFELILGSISEV